MTIAPMNNMNFPQNSLLSQLHQAERDLDKRREKEHFEKIVAVNPQFALARQSGLSQIDQAAQQKYEIERQKSAQNALAGLARDVQGGTVAPENALSRYAEITGDFIPLLRQGSGTQRVPAALQIANELQSARKADDMQRIKDIIVSGKLTDKGVTLDEDGNFKAAVGYGGALGELARGEKYGGKSGELQARQEREPSLAADIARQETQAESDVNLAMKPKIEAETETAKIDAKFMAEGRQILPILRRSLEAKELREDFLDEKINSINERANAMTTGFKGALMSFVPGDPAYDLNKDVETLLANAGFDRLQEMRDNSPTGGALGQVSERELSLLQAAAQNLITSQSEEQFKRNLDAFQEQRKQSLINVRAAYEEDLKRFGGQSQSVSQPAIKEISDKDLMEMLKNVE